ncbi:MAG: M48 family metallopeptidase, partial [Chitinophagaceae bacterium]|nr:M48 family metallopeptidase [Chitinophagaceae bacterium]
MRLFFLLVIVCSSLPCFSQSIAYKPLNDDLSQIKTWDATLAAQHKQRLDTMRNFYKADFKKIYESRYTDLKELTAQNRILTDSFANNYLQQMVKTIFDNNPNIPSKDYRIRFTRDYWPNAASLGEGTIIFNIGLFSKLQNESQVAFVLCHEIAHYHLQHSQKTIERYVTTINSKEYQEELRRIVNSQYQRGKQLETLARGVTFNHRRHSRDNEASADSMALELFRNTPFRTGEALNCLALLDSIDTDKYNVTPALEKLFNFPQYPFQQKWIKEEQSFFTAMAATSKEEKKKDRDSLKTHPDCEIRVKALTESVKKYSTGNKLANPLNAGSFAQLQELFDYEIIEHCYNNKDVSRSFYYTLQLLQSRPNDPYLIANTGRCLNRMFQAQKDHELNKIVDLPSPYQEEKY